MIKNISWSDFLMGVTILITIYYAVVGVVFYRKDWQSLLRIPWRKLRPDAKPPPDAGSLTVSPSDTVLRDESFEKTERSSRNQALFDQVEELAHDLRSAIMDAYKKDYPQSDLIFLLQLILREYKALRGTPFQIAIDNVIKVECAKYGFIRLSAIERDEIWKEVV